MTGVGGRRGRVSVAVAAVVLTAGARGQAEEFRLFPSPETGPPFGARADAVGNDDTIERPFRLSPASLASDGFAPVSDAESDSTVAMDALEEPTGRSVRLLLRP